MGNLLKDTFSWRHRYRTWPHINDLKLCTSQGPQQYPPCVTLIWSYHWLQTQQNIPFFQYPNYVQASIFPLNFRCFSIFQWTKIGNLLKATSVDSIIIIYDLFKPCLTLLHKPMTDEMIKPRKHHVAPQPLFRFLQLSM